MVYNIISQGTVDERIHQSAQRKLYLDALVISKQRVEGKSQAEDEEEDDEVSALSRATERLRGTEVVFSNDGEDISNMDLSDLLERSQAHTQEGAATAALHVPPASTSSRVRGIADAEASDSERKSMELEGDAGDTGRDSVDSKEAAIGEKSSDEERKESGGHVHGSFPRYSMRSTRTRRQREYRQEQDKEKEKQGKKKPTKTFNLYDLLPDVFKQADYGYYGKDSIAGEDEEEDGSKEEGEENETRKRKGEEGGRIIPKDAQVKDSVSEKNGGIARGGSTTSSAAKGNVQKATPMNPTSSYFSPLPPSVGRSRRVRTQASRFQPEDYRLAQITRSAIQQHKNKQARARAEWLKGTGLGMGGESGAGPGAGEAVRDGGGFGRAHLEHEEVCFQCDLGGELLMCDDCPKVYHLDCLNIPEVNPRV